MKKTTVLVSIVLAVTVIAVTIIVVANCKDEQTVVFIGPQVERCDHNRSRLLTWGERPMTALLQNVDFSPYLPPEDLEPENGPVFPRLVYQGNSPAVADRLATGWLLPVFSGIHLPLDDKAIGSARSDRDDLLAYLRAGSTTRAGVERPANPALTEAEVKKHYGPILDLLADRKALLGTAQEVSRRFQDLNAVRADAINDSRFPPGTFKAMVAIGVRRYWFVLARADEPTFSRLVVQPRKVEGQRYAEKEPR